MIKDRDSKQGLRSCRLGGKSATYHGSGYVFVMAKIDGGLTEAVSFIWLTGFWLRADEGAEGGFKWIERLIDRLPRCSEFKILY